MAGGRTQDQVLGLGRRGSLHVGDRHVRYNLVMRQPAEKYFAMQTV